MEDRPRRFQLCSSVDSLSQYLTRELSLICLLGQRLEHLREGRSGRTRREVEREISSLTSHYQIRINAESSYNLLILDHLSWTIAQLTLDIRANIDSDISSTAILPFILRDWVAITPELRTRFFQLQSLERIHYPERFERISFPLSPHLRVDDGTADVSGTEQSISQGVKAGVDGPYDSTG